jgi:hypothetical protein
LQVATHENDRAGAYIGLHLEDAAVVIVSDVRDLTR